MAELQIHLVPCLSDNYAYLIHDPDDAVTGIVDPSEEGPVVESLERHGLTLTHILNTHHHFDHTGGNLPLKERYGATIVGPKADEERIPGIDIALAEGDVFEFGSHKAKIFDIPAHTKGHIAFWFEADKAVFTGDTLFALGCGRTFEGTPPQMWESIQKLMVLPDDTRIYCGHEYTQANAEFALTVEPGNKALAERYEEIKRLRAKGAPTIPTTIALEKQTNPFMRPMSENLQETLGMVGADLAKVFTETRQRKDNF